MAASTYQFIFKKEKKYSYYLLELLLVLLHLIIFIANAIAQYPTVGWAYFGIIAVIIYWVLYFLNYKKPFKTNILALPIFLISLYWFITGIFWMGILVFVFAIFAVVSKQKKIILINNQEFLFTSFPKRLFSWDSLSNVVLKDGMLTIDFKNNKIIQQLIEDSTVDESAFNLFCAEQLQTANHQQ
jgi:hypothetical protein